MPAETVRKEVALEYCRRVNGGELEGVLELFAPDARLVDPLGSEPVVGRAAIAARLAPALRGAVHEEPGRPYAAHDGTSVVLPATVTVGAPGAPPQRRGRTRVMGVIEVGEDGLIREMRVMWGVTDSSWTARPAPDEERRKELAREHCLRINDGDVDGLLKLYSPRIRFEDPVGSWTRTGLEALRAHATMAVGSNVRETAGLTVAAQDGRHAAVTVSATMDYLPSGPLLARHHLMTLPAPAAPTRAHIGIEYVMVIGVDADGLIDEMRAYWGATDVSLLDPAA
ncbi:nuclear transport factor 2 family protein [Streptomyces longwoodensis]|uniref:nuclear transport factor 2 family protein n=1 Tax=Streptomyces longwoodensis TaxID=68231 RepID=UPI003701FC4C